MNTIGNWVNSAYNWFKKNIEPYIQLTIDLYADKPDPNPNPP